MAKGLRILGAHYNEFSEDQSRFIAGWTIAGNTARCTLTQNADSEDKAVVYVVNALTADTYISASLANGPWGWRAIPMTLQAEIEVSGMTAGALTARIYDREWNTGTWAYTESPAITANGTYLLCFTRTLKDVTINDCIVRFWLTSGTNKWATFTFRKAMFSRPPISPLWQVGGTPRPASSLVHSIPEQLPDTFKLCAALKTTYDSSDDMTNTLWRAGPYWCRLSRTLDGGTLKAGLELGNGTVTASTPLFTWSAGDRVYTESGRKNGSLFVRAKVESGAWVDGDAAAAAVTSGCRLDFGNRLVAPVFRSPSQRITIPDHSSLQNIFSGGGTFETLFRTHQTFGNYAYLYSKGPHRYELLNSDEPDSFSTFNYYDDQDETWWVFWPERFYADQVHSLQLYFNSDTFDVPPVVRLDNLLLSMEREWGWGTIPQSDAGFDLNIGYYDYFNNEPYLLISNFRLWDGQRDNHNDAYQRLTGNEPGLIGYWPLDEGEGSGVDVAIDLSPNANHGEFVGAAWASDSPANGVLFDLAYHTGAAVT